MRTPSRSRVTPVTASRGAPRRRCAQEDKVHESRHRPNRRTFPQCPLLVEGKIRTESSDYRNPRSIYRKPELNAKTDLRKPPFRSVTWTHSGVAATQNPVPPFCLPYFNRSRSDALHGGFSGLSHGQVKSRKSRKDSTIHRRAVRRKIHQLGPNHTYTAAPECRQRITSTEHFAWRATDSETLPMTMRSNPLRPCEPTTMTSAFHFSASSKIT
jgi:hypothetical protein